VRSYLELFCLTINYPITGVPRTKQVATIFTGDDYDLQEFPVSVGVQWAFLSDPDRTVQKDVDIAEYTDPQHNPIVPHTLALKPGLIIHNIYNGYWFWGRPSMDGTTLPKRFAKERP
jgi:hypothetical protein